MTFFGKIQDNIRKVKLHEGEHYQGCGFDIFDLVDAMFDQEKKDSDARLLQL